MAIAGAHHNQQLDAIAVGVASTDLVDRWTLTGISPCCACTRGGRDRRQ